MIISTEAIIINARKYGDSSKIVNIFSKEQGVCSVIAKGARNNKNKYGAALEQLSYSYISYYYKPSSSIHLLSNAELIQSFNNIHQSLEITITGLMIVESIAQTQHEHSQNEELFYSAVEALDTLNSHPLFPFSVFIRFCYNLSKILGFDINLNTDFDRPDDVYLLFDDGFSDIRPDGNRNDFLRLNPKDFDYLKTLSGKTIDESSAMPTENETIKSLINLFSKYFSYHLDKNIVFKSSKLLF